MKTIRPSASRVAAIMREASQQEQEALEGSGPEQLLNMSLQLMAKTTAHFVSTDEKLDGFGGILLQNEVRIAHIEHKMEA